MPTDNPRITFALSPELLEQISEYRFEHRIKNQSQAILDLMEKGLEVVEQKETEKTTIEDSLPQDEIELLNQYRKLNAAGKNAAVAMMRGLASDPASREDTPAKAIS